MGHPEAKPYSKGQQSPAGCKHVMLFSLLIEQNGAERESVVGFLVKIKLCNVDPT